MDHEAANVLLAEARRVVVMHKAARDAHYVSVKARRGEQAVRDLVAVVNTVRRTMKTEKD